MKRCHKLTNNQIQELSTIIKDNKRSGREARRAQSVLMLNADVDDTAITALTGYERRQVFRLRKRYLQRGIKAIEDKPKNLKELLTKRQRDEILQTIKTKTPNQCDSYYDSDYWTTGIAAAYIKRTYNVHYKSKTSVYIIFKQAKFTYHKPGRVYERRDEEEVQKWRTEAVKQVKEAWSDTDVVILTEDEMHLSSQTTVQKIWLPQGEYPKIEVSKKRESRSIYGFLNVKTGQEHAFKTKWQNMYITADILKEIRRLYPAQKFLLLWDKAGWHKGREAQQFIKEDGNIETLYYPTATPEENPQEHVWKSGRSHVTHNVFIKDIDKTTDDFISYLNKTTFPYSLLGFRANP
jgi:transposase